MSSLASKAVSGVFWNTGLNVFRDFLQFGVMLILVRLLAPEIYGQFGLVTSIMGFLGVFSFRSFLEHTLQIRSGGEVDYQLHFTVGAVMQVALFLITNLAAEILKHLPKYGQVAPVLHVMSILFLLDLGNEFRVKMLEREMDWKRLRILQGIGVVANAIVSLIMAAAGAGVYALLVPSLLISATPWVDLFFVHGWRPTWKWNRAAFVPAWKYGVTRLGSTLVLWTRNLIESTFLVQLAGFALYGIYGRALGLAAICCLKVPQLLLQALFPVLTKLDPGSGSSNKASALVLCSVTWSTFPAAVIFSALASPVVHFLYGGRWTGTIPFIPWAMAASTATALSLAGTTLLVSGLQQKRSLAIDAFTLAGTGANLLFLAPRDIKLYLIGITSVQAAGFLLILLWLYTGRRIDLRGAVNALVLPGASAGFSYLAMEFMAPYLGISKERLLGAISYGALFSLLYLVLLRLTSGQQCREFVRFLPGRSHFQRWLLLGA